MDITEKINDQSDELFAELVDLLENAGVKKASQKLADLCELEYALTSIEHEYSREKDFRHLIN